PFQQNKIKLLNEANAEYSSKANPVKYPGKPIETEFGSPVAPAFLHREIPDYPMLARKLGKEGEVILRLTIDEKGNLKDIEIFEKAGYGFTEAAIEAVKKSTFLPAKKGEEPVASKALLPIRFTLRRSQ
ncbi:MAG: TonB family protein, partial [Nitrospirota bacterium]